MTLFGRLTTALAFLTRLAPARMAMPEQLAASMPVFPAAGLVLGLVVAAPFAAGLFAGHPLVAGWLAAALSAWLTRGLHLDGLADVADAWGASARGERFWEIAKDSRLGAYGAMALVGGLGLAAALWAEAIAAGAFGVVVFAHVQGRFAAVLLAWASRVRFRAGLGELFAAGAGGGCLLAVLVQNLAFGAVLVSWPALWLSLGWLAAGLTPLYLLGRREGVNGDFLGCAVVWGELAAGLGFVSAWGA